MIQMNLQTKRARYKCTLRWSENGVRITVKEKGFLWFWDKVWQMDFPDNENYTDADQELNCMLAVSQYEAHLRSSALHKNEARS